MGADSGTVDKITPFSEGVDDKKTLSLTVRCCINSSSRFLVVVVSVVIEIVHAVSTSSNLGRVAASARDSSLLLHME